MEDLITPILHGIEQEITGGQDGARESGTNNTEAGATAVASTGHEGAQAQGLEAPPASRLNSLEPEGLPESCGTNHPAGPGRLDGDELVDEGALVNQILDDEEDEDIMVEGDVSVSIFARDHVGDDEVR